MASAIINRRTFLRVAVGTPLVAVSAASAYAHLIEPNNYRVSQTDIFIPDLPESFEGFRIAHLTDIHHSRIVHLSEIQRVVRLTTETRPDLIALTGDYTTSYRRYIEPCAETLAKLEAPYGVWAVLGNHDHYTDPELTRRALKRNHLSVLDNANTTLRRGSETLQLAGIDDWSWGASDLRRAVYGLERKRVSILLSHQPGVFDFGETRGMSLILSGHTHGGQVNLPFLGAPARFADKNMKYVRGLFRRRNTHLYVSSGTGVIGLPLRFGARPEIALLRLRRDLRNQPRD
jgi:hypothetical protein